MTAVFSPHAPALIGPYSQGRLHNGVLYAAGQLGIDPATGALVSDDPVEQLQQCLRNIDAVAQAAGTRLGNTLKVTLMLTSFERMQELNAAYAAFFADPFPARATLQVAGLPMAARVEVDAILMVPA